ncbi:DUF6090 family protein [Fulvivirga lutea]|uniref:Uncharacterized protein n=1 Tax=Fulvivirga lutea TaxID=2810512 RepID=A0A975A1Y6_9BACT|nr:DUF6090 family protein [Fulvivirga lutea]QSE98856.1 hypothetical protein JR347_07185 [Fulvivirga lutea]
MSNNKITTYLIYAIGEIALVVLGILIAVSIDDWNKDRQDRMAERELLEQLSREFKSNLDQLDEKILVRNNMINASIKLLSYCDNPSIVKIDSMPSLLATTVNAPTFDPIINDLISAGKLNLLSNSQLKERLSSWTSDVVQVKEDEQSWRKILTEQYTPFLVKYTSLRSILNKYWELEDIRIVLLDKDNQIDFQLNESQNPVDFKPLLLIEDFPDYLADCATWNKIANLQSETLRKRIVEILELIHEEII